MSLVLRAQALAKGLTIEQALETQVGPIAVQTVMANILVPLAANPDTQKQTCLDPLRFPGAGISVLGRTRELAAAGLPGYHVQMQG
jgi:hypothetical protein